MRPGRTDGEPLPPAADDRMTSSMVSARVSHPYLAGLALMGGGWWLLGLLLGVYGPASLGLLSSILHLLGLATLVGCGVAYAVLWWLAYLRERYGL